MCGIMAYIGQQEAYPIVIEGLKKLEYRGYDSAGIAIMNGTLSLHKKEGKVGQLEQFIIGKKVNGTVALGHTRWATHGLPNDTNAHPHTSNDRRLVMVHNGIIENYQCLKNQLENLGYNFQSDTDTEVLVQYIDWYQSTHQLSLSEAVRQMMQIIEGSYALVLLDTYDPDKLVLAKKDNPLAIGLGKDGLFIASDAGPIGSHTQEIVYLKDGEIAELNTRGSYQIRNIDNEQIIPEIMKINKSAEIYRKNGFDSYMLKEIFEQPTTIANSIADRIDLLKYNIVLPAVDDHKRIFREAQKVTIVACGTSFNAGRIGEYFLESVAGIPVEVEYASEFRYRSPIIQENEIVMAISQSGETADTLAALKLANRKGAFTYSLVNTKGSSIDRLSDVVSYINVGPEISVASTKAFTGQVALLSILAIKLGQLRGALNSTFANKYIDELHKLPAIMEEALDTNRTVSSIAQYLKDKEHTIFLGRGINYPLAMEGALKLKELSYIHAEGYPAAEMKHGPIALVDEEMPIIVLATNQSCTAKLISNIQEMKSRKGKIILVKNKYQSFPKDIADYTIEVPAINEMLTPIISAIPLQLLSYHVAKLRGCDIDQPRNLAKSVTVE